MFDISQFSLKGKIAVITGGGRGIGQAIAFAFAKAGAKVAITSRKVQDLEATANEIKAFGGEALPISAHLGKAEEIKKMVNTVMEKFGRIDILVNNAGIYMGGSINDSDLDVDGITRQLAVNVGGVFATTRAAVPFVESLRRKQ